MLSCGRKSQKNPLNLTSEIEDERSIMKMSEPKQLMTMFNRAWCSPTLYENIKGKTIKCQKKRKSFQMLEQNRSMMSRLLSSMVSNDVIYARCRRVSKDRDGLNIYQHIGLNKVLSYRYTR